MPGGIYRVGMPRTDFARHARRRRFEAGLRARIMGRVPADGQDAMVMGDSRPHRKRDRSGHDQAAARRLGGDRAP